MKRILLVQMVFFLGCSGPTITSNFDTSVDFNSYETFAITTYKAKLKSNQQEYENPKVTEIIRQAITKELNKAGYKLTTEAPDLLVVYDIVITEMVDPRVDSAVIYKPWVDTKIDTFNYTEGLLVVRLIDRAEGNMIWQGSLAGILNRKPEQFAKRVDTYLAKLFTSLTAARQ